LLRWFGLDVSGVRFILLMLALISGGVASASPGTNSAIREIDGLVARLDAQHKASLAKAPAYYQTYLQNYSVGEWKRLGTGKEFEGEAPIVAKLVGDSVTGHILYYEEQSPSHDWQVYSTCYYRPSSSLALVDWSFRTFYSEKGVRVERRGYFDDTGKRIRMKESQFDLKSQRAVSHRQFHDRDVTLWKSLADIPFMPLTTR